ncbi:hypothetical protein [Silicimonas sp. MF1-12-2]|jgi:hypothetical protein
MWRVLNRIRRYLAGRRFDAALRRNNEAADRLDAALREVLKR